MIGQRRRLQLLVGIHVVLVTVSVLYERQYGDPELFFSSWTYWLPMASTVFLILYVMRLRCRVCRAHQVVRGSWLTDLRWPDERCYSCGARMTGSAEAGVSAETHTPPKVRVSENAEFWKETERRRNLFFITWIGWLLAGPVLMVFYRWFLNPDHKDLAGMAALFTWGVFWYWTYFNLRRMRCPECGEKAFIHPFFFMRHARCQSCGVIPKSD